MGNSNMLPLQGGILWYKANKIIMNILTEEEKIKGAQKIAGVIIATNSLERQIHQQLAYNGIEWTIQQLEPLITDLEQYNNKLIQILSDHQLKCPLLSSEPKMISTSEIKTADAVLAEAYYKHKNRIEEL